ncbi:MAG: cytochrome c [Paracoccaceae bacterium]|nr:cytochrome c [Paracoccaceae bacterium]
MFKNRILGAIALSSLGAAALAHNGATGIVMERMMGMAAMRDIMRDLAPMMQAQVPYDAWAVQQAAGMLQSHAGGTMVRLFPEEPIPASSFAKPEIWGDWARFADLSEELRLYSAGLAVASVNGLDAPMPAPKADAAETIAGIDHSAMQMAPPPVRFSVAELMGVTAPATRAPMMAAIPSADGQTTGIDFASMAADDVFERISQTCASCHSLYRKGN